MARELRTQDDVFKLEAPDTGEKVYFDKGKARDAVAGLSLRVRAAGSRRWALYYRYAGIQKRLVLGDASAMDLDAARKRARQCRIVLDDGEDPAVERIEKRDAAKLLFGKIVAEYLEHRKGTARPRGFEATKRHLMVHWKQLHGYPIGKVNRSVVAAGLREITKERGAVSANRARTTLAAFYSWAIKETYCDENPTSNTNVHKEKPRTRTLKDAELAKIWLACGDNPYGKIVRLLMLTACRREEIGALRWSEIEREPKDWKIVLPASRTKNGVDHVVPLTAQAQAIIEQTHHVLGQDTVFARSSGFSDWSGSKAELDEACGVADWTLHDIRRTVRTGLGNLKDKDGKALVLPHVAEAVLNHLPPKLVRTYDTNSYDSEKRAALEQWASHLMVEVGKATGANVTRLHKAK